MHSDQDRSEIIDPIYLPFAKADLHRHFLVDADRQVRYFEESADRYHKFLAAHPKRNGVPLREARGPCQIEKDERFWTAATLKHLVDSPRSVEVLCKLLSNAFGERPPLVGLPDWPSCLAGGVALILEASLASPPLYVEWLRENLPLQHLVPYVLSHPLIPD